MQETGAQVLCSIRHLQKREKGERQKQQSGPKGSKLAQDITPAKEAFPNVGLTYLFVGQPSVRLVWFSISQARPIV